MTDGRFVGPARLMNAGPLQPLIDALVAELRARQHTSLTVSGYEHSAPMFKPGRFRATDKLLAMLNSVSRSGDYAE